MARHCKRFCLLLAATCALLASRTAQAYEEQLSLDLGLGYSLLAGPEHPLRQGGAAEIGAAMGLSASTVLRANAGYAALVRAQDVQHLGRFRLEALYLLDVLQVVPFCGLGATVSSAPDSTARVPLRAGPHLVLGVDYLLSRRWIAGLDLRSALMVEGGHLLNASDVSLRLSRMFETF